MLRKVQAGGILIVSRGYKLTCFTAVHRVFWVWILLLLLSLTTLAGAQQNKSSLWGFGKQKKELSKAEAAKRDLQKLKMEIEKVSQERNRYRRMFRLLQQRVDKLTRRLQRVKAMDSNNDKQILDLVKKNKQYAQHISELEQKNRKLENQLEEQSQKLKNLANEKKERQSEDINLKEGDSNVNRLKVRLMEHKEMVEKIRRDLAELTEKK